MGASRRASLALGGVVLAAAFLLRIANLDVAFLGGVPLISPLDDLYQAKRILYSARHFPAVLDFDPDRGTSGAFCPWPPLYPLAAGGLAALLGGRSTEEILTRAAWIPPVFSSLVSGLLAALLARRLGWLAGAAGGVAMAVSIPLVEASRIGAIDHHFLESALLLGVLGATLLIADGSRRPRPLVDGLLLALSLVAALFVQIGLLPAAALSFVAIYFFCGDDAALLSGATGFGAAAAAVALHLAGRPEAGPPDVWFLGLPHLAALLGAAVACALRFGFRRRWNDRAAAVFALAGGAGVALSLPDVPWAWFGGASFFGQASWLHTIAEFQPLFRGGPGSVNLDVLRLGGAAFLVPPLALLAFRSPSRTLRTAALFSAAYLVVAIRSQRFLVPAAPLLAVAAALVVSHELRAGRRLVAAACVALVLVPAGVGLPALVSPASAIPTISLPPIRAANWLKRAADRPGRVLGPWSWGHLFDVVGERPVLVDNFGPLIERVEGNAALAAPLLPGEERLAEFCRRAGVRFVVLENPLRTLSGVLVTVGQDEALYLRPGAAAGKPPTFTRLAQASFWWRAYFDQGRARPEAGRWGRPFRSFRLVWADKENSGDPAPFSGPAMQIWEFVPEAVPGAAPGRS